MLQPWVSQCRSPSSPWPQWTTVPGCGNWWRWLLGAPGPEVPALVKRDSKCHGVLRCVLVSLVRFQHDGYRLPYSRKGWCFSVYGTGKKHLFGSAANDPWKSKHAYGTVPHVLGCPTVRPSPLEIECQKSKRGFWAKARNLERCNSRAKEALEAAIELRRMNCNTWSTLSESNK